MNVVIAKNQISEANLFIFKLYNIEGKRNRFDSDFVLEKAKKSKFSFF